MVKSLIFGHRYAKVMLVHFTVFHLQVHFILQQFFNSIAGAELSMLVGNVVAIVSGGILTVVVTLITNRDFSEAQAIETWENTRDIDSPLSPWTELYARLDAPLLI